MYINNSGHMTKMAAMTIYGKIPFKNLLLRKITPVDQFQQNLTCSIVDKSTTMCT